MKVEKKAIVILMACLAISFFSFGNPLQITEENKQQNLVQFKCPPCGCSNDHVLVEGPGNCSVCYMQLVERNYGMKESIDNLVAPSLHSGFLGKVYTKLIYPVFAIGILFSIFLLFYRIKGQSLNIYLIGIILIISLFSFKNQLFGVNYGLTSTYESLFTPISFILALGPFIYLYIRNLIGHREFSKIEWIHLAPAFAMFAYYLTLTVMPETVKLNYMFSPFEVYLAHTEQVIAILSGFIYLHFGYRAYQKWKVSYSVSMSQTNSWIIRFMSGMALLLLGWSIMVFLNYWLYDLGVATVTYNPLWVWMGLIVTWLGIEIIINPKFFLINKPAALTNGSKVINDLELMHYKLKLEEIMLQDKLYRNPELNLDFLASMMNINPRYLSTLLNNAMGKSFYDFINKYRIEEVKVLLKDPENKNLTIEAIANQAGFKSKSSFNSAFKKYTKMTPREFIKHELVA